MRVVVSLSNLRKYNKIWKKMTSLNGFGNRAIAVDMFSLSPYTAAT
jgi:hypothetical protein